MKDFLEWLRNHPAQWTNITLKVDNDSIAWAGFWIGLGIVLAAAVMKGQVIFK